MTEVTVRDDMQGVNLKNVDALVSELRDFIRILGPIAELLAKSPGLFSHGVPAGDTRESLEAQAIIMLTTMGKPNLSEIARRLKLPRSTVRGFPNFAKAMKQVIGNPREPRRGRFEDTGADSFDDD